MSNETERRPKFDFRLLEMKDPFYDYLAKNDIPLNQRSKVVRHFLKQGLQGGGVDLETQSKLLAELIEVKRNHAGIGRNLNQIARYFNTHEHLVESDLHQTLKHLADIQKTMTGILNSLTKELGG